MAHVTFRTYSDLSTLHDAIVRGRKVRWTVDGSNILEGVLRHFCEDKNGSFARPDSNPLEVFLRISSTFEHFLKVDEVVEMMQKGWFVIDN